jgi:3-hydroxyisobutyrate dehydrogenase-like beta-hydroxyacid dehydrogenase
MERVMTAICLLGFGEVGQILAQDLRAADVADIASWDPRFDDPTSGPSRARGSTIRVGCDARSAVSGANIVISAVTAGQTLDAARSAAPSLRSGVIYLDLNSTAPAVKRAAAEIVLRSGAAYVEAAVMSPVSPKRLRTSMLLGGLAARDFLPQMHRLGFEGAKFYSEEVGKASAVKMCRSVIVKGMEALLAESMLAARKYQVEEDVLATLSALFTTSDWRQLARYMISRSVEHGVRRAEEMRDAARTVAGAGIAPLMTDACVERQEWAPQFKNALTHEDLGGFLDAILTEIEKSKDLT